MVRRYRFDQFELSVQPPELRRTNGTPVAVSPKVLALISHLVENPGRLIDKSELLDRVWGHRHLTDAALARLIMRARRALGDDGQAQRIIRTVHGQGVMFVAPVDELADEETGGSGRSERATEPLPSSKPKHPAVFFPALALTALLVLLTAFAAPRWWTPTDESGDPSSEQTIQPVYLRGIRHDPDDSGLADLALALPALLSDRLIEAGIPVVAVEAGEGDGSAPALQPEREVRIDLKREAGLLVAEVRSSSDRSEWPPVKATTEAELSRQLSRLLLARLVGHGNPTPHSDPARDPMIDDLELRARIAWLLGDAVEALRALDAALALDPEQIWLRLLRTEYALIDAASPADLLARMRADLDAAGERLTPMQRAAVLQRAGVHAWYAGDAASAEALLLPALALAREASAPLQEGLIRSALSQAQNSMGRGEAAWDNAQLALELLRQGGHAYHLSLALTNMAYLAEERGRLESARRWHQEALELRQRYGFARLIAASQYGLARIARRSGRLVEARQLAEQAAMDMQSQGQDFDRISALEELAEIAMLTGDYPRADATLDEAEALAIEMDDALGLAWLADVRGRLRYAQGRLDEAASLLRRSIETQQAQGELREVVYTRIALLDVLSALALGGDPAVRAELAELEQGLAGDARTLSQDQQVALRVVQLRQARLRSAWETGARLCREALSQARDSGALDHEAEAALECALLQYAADNPDEGRRMEALAQSWSSDWTALQALDAFR